MLAGRWELTNCDAGLYSTTVTISVSGEQSMFEDTVRCADLAFETSVPGDITDAEVLLTTSALGVWVEPLTLDHDIDLALITFQPGPLED